MRVFWAVIGVLVVGAAVLVALRGATGEGADPGDTVAAQAVEAPAPGRTEHAGVLAEPRPAAALEQEQAENVTASAPPSALPPEVQVKEVAPDVPAEPAAERSMEEAVRAALLDEGDGLDAALGFADPLAGPEPEAVATDVPGPPATGQPRETPAKKPAADPAAPASLVPQDDGSVLVDGRYAMRGEGTAENPYVISWEHLLSAQEVYQPRLGLKVLPDRVKMLDGKWVKLSGYVAFPIMAASPDEMLAMLNQWDGCCIGVPPTPYDAVEVKLKKPAEGPERQRVSGTVVGKLRVDPYLVKDWLVSLYLMDDAELVGEAK